MKLRLQFGGWLLAAAISAALALPCAAQNRNSNRPPQQRRQQAPKQASRPPQRQRAAPSGRPNAPRNNAANRPTPTSQTESMGMIGGNRPQNISGESNRQPNFNPNRPPKRFQDLSPADKQKVLQNREKFNQLPPQKQQEIRERAREWQKLTPEQQNHIKNDVLPIWKQLPPARQRAISNRLAVLQSMPESARNQHLNDPNFTRGLSEEDKAMLRDLSHMHVGAPDPPGE